MNRKVINFILLKIFNPFINFLLNLLNFIIIFRFGAAIGDHVYLSSIIRQININSNISINSTDWIYAYFTYSFQNKNIRN